MAPLFPSLVARYLHPATHPLGPQQVEFRTALTDSKFQLAWMISFISSIIARIQVGGDNFPGYTWWTIVFYFFLVVGVSIVVASDTAQTYHVALVGYLACGLVLATSSVNTHIYSENGAREAASAGFILLSMVTVCDSFALMSQIKWLVKIRATFATYAKSCECRLSGPSTSVLRPRPFHEPTWIPSH